jgi:GTP-binding protein
LLETMRREGYEVAVSRPEVIQKEVDGEIHEPYELLVIDVEDQHQGAVMELLGQRKGELKNMEPDGRGRVKLEYLVPSRGLIGLRGLFLTLTSGSGIMTSIFDHYGPVKMGELLSRQNGVLVSMVKGKALGFSLFNLQDRGRLFLRHGEEVYEGQIVGIHSRANDLAVNPTKGKQLTNVRASGTDEALTLVAPIRHTLEQALEFIEDDELVEITPHHIRVRKKLLSETQRKRAGRAGLTADTG